MRNSRIVKNILSLLPIASVFLILSLIGIRSSFDLIVYGHNFSTDETASFVAFANQLQVESELVKTNLADNNLPLAQKHANKAASLLIQT